MESLFQLTPTLTPKLKSAARVILDNPNLVATTSMRSLAKRCAVTPPTMIRLAKAVGYENYESFRRVFQEAINEQNFASQAGRLQRSSAVDGLDAIVKEIATASLRNLSQFHQELDLDALNKAARLIIDAPQVHVIAAGGIHWMASYLHYVCKMAVPQIRLPLTSGNGLVEGLISLAEGDVILVMAYHPYSRHAIEAAEFALARGGRMIYLTDSRAAPLASRAEVLLLQKTASPQFFPSVVAVMAALETLIAAIVALGGESAIDNISDYLEIRKESEFYIN
ncbi:MAG: MurR/RpiR family transcriptional regulator [Gammaproteobacteria bacterium]|nr:MurR/RpiR family transcriptional regulator [Gammaproteobacteria bacterium]